MNANRRIDNTEEVFNKEFEKLRFFKDLIKNDEISADDLKESLSNLLKDYESLLTDAVKITRIGDVSQHKLLKAKEKIEELNAKLVESERNVRELNTILMFYIKATDK
jgi:peptidoglycan hydrolase CwlO-like protein